MSQLLFITMEKKKKIPVLKKDSYQKSYFKDEYQPQKDYSLSSSVHHFEMFGRCIWKNNIPAHRLDFYLVFIVSKGAGTHSFGLKEHYVKENMLCFVGPDVISSWNTEVEEHRGFFCAFSDEFFNVGSTDRSFLKELPFFQVDGNSVLHLTDDQNRYYIDLFQSMYDEYQNRNEYSPAILRSQLHLLINKAYAQYRLEENRASEASHSGLRLLKAFTALYMRDFKALGEGQTIRLKKVAEYANELGVSQNHLNDTIKAITGKSAGQHIKNQLMKYATICLNNSSKSISEIAYQLGYSDPSYFTRYYKSHTGFTPSDLK